MREPLSLDMLSEAYSEVGRFVEAVQAARRALNLAMEQNNQDLASALKARIAAYETNTRARRG